MYADLAVLLLRIVAGVFLVWGVADNVGTAEHMRAFERFLAGFRFPVPARMGIRASFLK